MTIRRTSNRAADVVVREGDTTNITVATGLGDLSAGTATAQFLTEDTNVLAHTVTCTGLDSSGNVTIDLTTPLATAITAQVRFLVTVTAVVGGETNTSPSWDQEAFVVLVEPKYE